MSLPADHNRLIAHFARARLAPLGCQRKGRSRLWFDDQGWWAGVVEFQPSGWSKGSYLNVGAMWLWAPVDHWVFHEFDRAEPFHEFEDESQFAAAVARLADRAGTEILAQRQRFAALPPVAAILEPKRAEGLWPRYHAAMAAALTGQLATAQTRFLEFAGLATATPWADARARATRLAGAMASAHEAQRLIAQEVHETRAKLGLAPWPAERDLWAVKTAHA